MYRWVGFWVQLVHFLNELRRDKYPEIVCSGANYVGKCLRWGELWMAEMGCNPKKKGGLFSRPELRGKDLNLRPLGYET